MIKKLFIPVLKNDFAIPGEITVTITLNEYRALISADAISEKKSQI